MDKNMFFNKSGAYDPTAGTAINNVYRPHMTGKFAKPFYSSKEWQKVRKIVLSRDLYICQHCGELAVEVHHKIWLTPQNIDDPEITLNTDNLISLCNDCHFAIHRNKKTQTEEQKECGFDEKGNFVRLIQNNSSGPA